MPHEKSKEAMDRYLITLDDMLLESRSNVARADLTPNDWAQREAALEAGIEAVRGHMALRGWLK